MPIYSYECEFCDHTFEEFRPIKDGPRKNIICKICEEPMYLQFSGAFILKGNGWPGKEINNDYILGGLADKAGKVVDEYDGRKKESREVLSHRRRGKKHFREWKKHNKEKTKRYSENVKDGITGRNA